MHRLTRPYLNVALARQTAFNNQLVALLSLLVSQVTAPASARSTQSGAPLRRRRGQAGRALERQLFAGDAQAEALLARLQRIVEEQSRAGAALARRGGEVAAVARRAGARPTWPSKTCTGGRATRSSAGSRSICRTSGSRSARGRRCWTSAAAAASSSSSAARPACRPAAWTSIPRWSPSAGSGGWTSPRPTALALPARAARRRPRGHPAEPGHRAPGPRPADRAGGAVRREARPRRRARSPRRSTPRRLSTFAGAFYVDLTHTKPVHPEAARFLWRWAGLGDVADPLPLARGPRAAAGAAARRDGRAGRRRARSTATSRA